VANMRVDANDADFVRLEPTAAADGLYPHGRVLLLQCSCIASRIPS
jgi:hypothetical protein